jgi:hypothetical protein
VPPPKIRVTGDVGGVGTKAAYDGRRVMPRASGRPIKWCSSGRCLTDQHGARADDCELALDKEASSA